MAEQVNVEITWGCDVAVSSPTGEWVALEPGDVVAVSKDKADNLISNGCGNLTEAKPTRPFANPGGTRPEARRVKARPTNTNTKGV